MLKYPNFNDALNNIVNGLANVPEQYFSTELRIPTGPQVFVGFSDDI